MQEEANLQQAYVATPSADTRTIATATRALVHYAESHGVHIKFTHVHSHQGHGLNELADNMAKAGADFLHCIGAPFHLHQDWYKQGTGMMEWAWLMRLSPWGKTQCGVPPVEENVLPFPIAKMPCMHTLADYIASAK